MQTVLGSTGPIGEGVARALHDLGHHDLRLVSRRPTKVAGTDELLPADLTDAAQTDRAVAGSEVVYLTVGLPMDSALWEAQFPPMVDNVVASCERHGAKLVFFDNTYMYPGTAAPQTEDTVFAPNGRKGRVRAALATTVLDAVDADRVEALVCRAPEFYGPRGTKSLTSSLVLDRIRAGKQPLVPISARTRRSLVWTPDASRAMALLGTAPDTYGRTWHLPIDSNRLTYAQIVAIAAEVTGRRLHPIVVPEWLLTLGGRVDARLGEVVELLPRYRGDNLFDASAFAARFPDFTPTTYREGITTILTGRDAG